MSLVNYIRRQEDQITYDASVDGSNSSTLSLPTNSYLINTIMTDGIREIVEVDRHRLLILLSNPLTSPTSSRRVYVRKTSEGSGNVEFPANNGAQHSFITLMEVSG